MTHPFNTLQFVENASGKNAKMQQLELGDSPLLRTAIDLAMNPNILFGFTTLPERSTISNLYRRATVVQDMDLRETQELFVKLLAMSQVPKNNQYRDEIAAMLKGLSDRDYKWVGRIILKKLRIGLDEDVKKVFPGLLPDFKVMLSYPIYKLKKPRTFPRWLSPKMDGVRIIAIKRDGEITLHHREGNLCTSLPHIVDHLSRPCWPDGVYDGEAYNHQIVTTRGFNKFLGMVTCDEPHADHLSVEYHIFDYLTLTEWDEKRCSRRLSHRAELLGHYFDQYEALGCCGYLHEVVNYECLNEEEVTARVDQFLKDKYEGGMDKDPDGPYEWKRSWYSLKLKNFIDFEAEMVGTYAGNGKRANTIGGIILKVPDDKVLYPHDKKINDELLRMVGNEFRTGSGLDDATLAAVAANPEAYIGQKVTVKCFIDPGHDVPRWPVFKAFRKAGT